jgi:imidazolonepropionase-like amidohydrolase
MGLGAGKLFECHGHIILDGSNYAASMELHKNGVDTIAVRAALKKCAESGVAFYRDGGDKYFVSAYAKKIAPEYGIDYRTPVFMAHKKGCYGGMFGFGFEDMPGFRALVREIGARGADFVKLAVNGIMDFNGGGRPVGGAMDESELRESVNIAHGEGFAVMAHVNGATAIKAALRAGVDSIEHGYWPDREAADTLLQTGAVWTPTRAAVENLISTGKYRRGVLEGILDAQAQWLKYAYGRGAHIASGSDGGAYSVAQGGGTLDEYRMLGALGIDPAAGNERVAGVFRV